MKLLFAISNWLVQHINERLMYAFVNHASRCEPFVYLLPCTDIPGWDQA